MTFLGCEQTFVETIKGKLVRGVEWDVSHSMKRCVAKYEVAAQQCTGKFPRMTLVYTPFLPDETKYARSRAPANNEDYVECPTCRDSCPSGKKRSLKELVATDDGGVQPWMHGLLTNMGGGIPNHDDSDDDTADMPTLSDTSSNAGDEEHIDRLDEDADDSDDDNIGLITAMNLLSPKHPGGNHCLGPKDRW